MSVTRYSNCCGALPLGELCETELDGETLYMGRCSRCKDGAVFFTEEEQAIQDGYDEGMHMGGDKYNDTMFGAGDELEHERMDD